MPPKREGIKFNFQIFVKMPNEKTVTLEVCRTNTVLELKNIILDKEGIPVELQRLVTNKMQLRNQTSLGAYNI